MPTLIPIEAEHVERYKTYYPDLDYLQNSTVEHFKAARPDGLIDWHSFTPRELLLQEPEELEVSDCQIAIGYVVFDVICLALAAYGMRAGVSKDVIKAMGREAAPAMSGIQTIVAQLASPAATTADKARGVIRIALALKNTNVLKKCIDVFIGSLTWYNAILFGIGALATVAALVLTGGAATVAQIAVILVSVIFLIEDVASAVKICILTPTTPDKQDQLTPGAMPFPPRVALKTSSGKYVCVIFNGGFAGNAVIETNRRHAEAWESFKIVPVGNTPGYFGIQTASGNYLTAMQGGNVGGPNIDTSPVHTDSLNPFEWCQLTTILHEDGTYSFCTKEGYYLTAVNGGGINANDPIFHTDAGSIQSWETFSFTSLPTT